MVGYVPRMLRLIAVSGLVSATSAGALAADARSTEVLRYECKSDLGRRDVTLFANGTVRLRQGAWEAQELYLDELRREELGSYLDRLREVLAGAERVPDLSAGLPEGGWVDDCRVYLSLPGIEPVAWFFSELEIPPLAVSQLIHVADELAELTRRPIRTARLPTGYVPRPGDVLRTPEGGRFRVVDLTTDERAVELENLDAPLSIFVPVDELREVFSVLEEQGSP